MGHSAEDIAEKVALAVQKCIWESNFSKDRISGVGIGIPGLVDHPSGTIRFLPNYGWENGQFERHGGGPVKPSDLRG